MRFILKHSMWIYLVLFAAVIYLAIQAKKKYLPAEQVCQQYSQGQKIENADDEMDHLAKLGALVKIQAGQSQSGSYPIIEIYNTGSEHPLCRIHIENKTVTVIDADQP